MSNNDMEDFACSFKINYSLHKQVKLYTNTLSDPLLHFKSDIYVVNLRVTHHAT